MTRRPSLAGGALLLVVVSAGCYGRNNLTTPDSILLVTASPATIPADGVSSTIIEVTVVPEIDRGLPITFTASAGTISSQSFFADSNGRVVTTLKSATTPQTVLVTVNVKRGDQTQASRTISVVFERADGPSIIKLTLSSRDLPADGASSIELRADLNPGVTTHSVKFDTTSGSFSPDSTTRTTGDIPTDSNGVGRARLYAPRVLGSALVTVTGGTFSASDTVTFVPALPDAIALQAVPLTITRSETAGAVLTAVLSRQIGKVTENTSVVFSAQNDQTGQPFGRFQNVKRSSADQVASAEFVTGAAAPVGLATITAQVQGTNLSVSLKVVIQ